MVGVIVWHGQISFFLQGYLVVYNALFLIALLLPRIAGWVPENAGGLPEITAILPEITFFRSYFLTSF